MRWPPFVETLTNLAAVGGPSKIETSPSARMTPPVSLSRSLIERFEAVKNRVPRAKNTGWLRQSLGSLSLPSGATIAPVLASRRSSADLPVAISECWYGSSENGAAIPPCHSASIAPVTPSHNRPVGFGLG